MVDAKLASKIARREMVEVVFMITLQFDSMLSQNHIDSMLSIAAEWMCDIP